MESDKQLLEYILKAICTDGCKVERIVDERGVLLTIRTSRIDMPLVVGREGSIIGSIRRLVKVVGRKNNANVSIRLLEP